MIGRKGEKIRINIEPIKSGINPIMPLLKVALGKPEARGNISLSLQRIKQIKFMFTLVPVNFLLMLLGKGKTTKFILLILDHVKISSQDPRMKGQHATNHPDVGTQNLFTLEISWSLNIGK